MRGDDRVDLHARGRAAETDAEVLPAGAPVADLAPQVGDELAGHLPAVGGLAQNEAVKVEQHGRAADEGRQRREDRVETLLLEHDLGELLVHREAALQQRVLFVDDLRRDGLADGDERHVVGHLEDGEVVLLRDADERFGDLVETEPGADAQTGQVVVDEALEPGDLLLLGAHHAVTRAQQQLAALEPLGGIGDLGDVHPPDRVAHCLRARQQLEVEIGNLENVLDRDHLGLPPASSASPAASTFRRHVPCQPACLGAPGRTQTIPNVQVQREAIRARITTGRTTAAPARAATGSAAGAPDELGRAPGSRQRGRARRAPASTRPGRAPVCSPPATTGSPFTKTCSMPSG